MIEQNNQRHHYSHSGSFHGLAVLPSWRLRMYPTTSRAAARLAGVPSAMRPAITGEVNPADTRFVYLHPHTHHARWIRVDIRACSEHVLANERNVNALPSSHHRVLRPGCHCVGEHVHHITARSVRTPHAPGYRPKERTERRQNASKPRSSIPTTQ